MRNEYSKAEESYIQSRDLYSGMGDQLGLANSLTGLGQLHSHRHEYAKAGESYLEAQQLYNQTGDRCSLANISLYLGVLHRQQAQYEDAERLVREASTIYRDLGLKNRVEVCDKVLDQIRRFTEKALTPGP
ncbi:hypothetical protein M407DRAFT_245674 [Tulasnella calospora MUT 4182]|uniref:Uncharacterized protein n=1 Tax=Tulasnella calospora MUT 4182 TaxID=1051891 RepID=A0A0C3QA15_9AGAM|nr:hypothetical protein M407DRAFT_245674 [Tulasnella calospora MUT 4182]